MNYLHEIFENIGGVYKNSPIEQTTVVAMLVMVTFLAIYEFAIYRFVSHRSFYNKSFNLAIAILPYFISTIILCLQSNVVVTLGTIGALAIIRFRTAVKDPVDMIYLLWSIHTGIICGCQLFPIAIITSIAVTIVLLILENTNFGRKPHIVIIHSKNEIEDKLKKIFSLHCRGFRIKSRNFSGSGVDYAIEATIKDPKDLARRLKNAKKVERFSIIEYDSDDLV
jgi:uncharacterized membrane protein YhiD involved in acid resistance